MKTQNPLLLIFFSIFFSFLLLEILLRFAGWVFLLKQEYSNHHGHGKEAYRILCIGESTTALGGKDSYPSQLQNILNLSQSAEKFEVINKGIPAVDTNTILSKVPGWIDEYNPNMVVAMMGINDHFSMKKLEVANPLISFVKSLRVVKLAIWIKNSFSNRAAQQQVGKPKEVAVNHTPEEMQQMYMLLQYGLALKQQKNYDKAAQVFLSLVQRNFDDDYTSRIYGEWLDMLKTKEYNHPEQEIYVLKYLLPKDPKSVTVTDEVVKLCRPGNANAAPMLDALKGITALTPNNPAIYNLLSYCSEGAGDVDSAKLYKEQAESLYGNTYEEETKSNYEKLIKLLRNKGVAGVFVQYPTLSLNSLKNMLKDLDGYSDLIFVDNESSFNEAVKNSSYETIFYDRFAIKFGHSTAKGNHILARNVADTILKCLKNTESRDHSLTD